MCGAMMGCVVCEGYAFFIKKAHLLNFLFGWLATKLAHKIVALAKIQEHW